MSSCVILYKFQNLRVLFGTSHDDFRCWRVELQQISDQLDFLAQKFYIFLGH